MTSKRDLLVLVLATAVTRFAFRSRYLYDIDSVNFALALKRFDPVVHQPHPPGYFLYMCLGRLFNLFFHDANTSLVAMSIVFSAATVAMIYWLALRWFGRTEAVLAALIFLFSPLAWFHGTVALTYIVEAFFSALIGFLCWEELALPSAVVAGIAAGFRPSSLLFLGPLFLFSLRNAGRKRAFLGIAALAGTVLAWIVPMMVQTGGLHAWLSAFLSLWSTVPSKESVFNSSILNSAVRALVIVAIYFLCFGCAALLPLLKRDERDGRKTLFTWVWITPGLLFFTFVYLKFVTSGYLLVLMPPICAWLGNWGAGLYQSRKGWVAAGAAVNIGIFLFAPVYCSYNAVHRFEAELGGIVAALPEVAPSANTVIVGMDSHFLGYRHAGYYLPDYVTAQYPEVRLTSGIRVFSMEGRDTAVVRNLDTASAGSFVFFPLPLADSEYRDYMAKLRSRFPPGDLRVVSRDGHEFVMGPVADLHLLFPNVYRR